MRSESLIFAQLTHMSLNTSMKMNDPWKRKSPFYFFISLGIHWMIIFAISEKRKQPPITVPQEELLLSLTSEKVDPPRVSRKKRRPQKRGGKKGSMASRQALEKFKPHLWGPTKHWDYRKTDGKTDQEWQDHPTLLTHENIPLQNYSQNYYFFETLSKKLNQNIGYPKEFVEHEISGKTWVKILLNKKGQLIKVIDSSKTQPLLTSYLIVSLHKTLGGPLDKRHWYKSNKELPLAFRLDFEFSYSSVHSVPVLKTVSYNKNFMTFRRRERSKDIIAKFSEDHARYIPPIIPTPAGPIINFVQIYKMVKAWQGMSPGLRRKQKLAITRERLEHLLKKKEKDVFDKVSGAK